MDKQLHDLELPNISSGHGIYINLQHQILVEPLSVYDCKGYI